MYGRILLPTDGSDEMTPVVDHAGELARIHDATVEALYVVDTASLSTLPMDASLDSLHGMLQEEGEAALEAAERALPDHVPVAGSVREGSPARAIIDHGRETDCDVVVMGTHGRGGLDRLLLGSVAEEVVRKSPLPVLTVRVGDGGDATS